MANLRLEADELHVEYLGTYQYTLGNVMWLLVFMIMPVDEQTNMDRLSEFICEWYRVNASTVQCNNISLSSFADPDKPLDFSQSSKAKAWKSSTCFPR